MATETKALSPYEKSLARFDGELTLLNNGESNVDAAIGLIDAIPRAGMTTANVEEMERNIIAQLTELFERNPEDAMRIAGRFTIGAGYSDLRMKVMDLEREWQRKAQPQVQTPVLEPEDEDVMSLSLAPGRPKPQPRKMRMGSTPEEDVPMLERQRGG